MLNTFVFKYSISMSNKSYCRPTFAHKANIIQKVPPDKPTITRPTIQESISTEVVPKNIEPPKIPLLINLRLLQTTGVPSLPSPPHYQITNNNGSKNCSGTIKAKVNSNLKNNSNINGPNNNTTNNSHIGRKKSQTKLLKK